jgi:hypothetical protein
MTAAAKIECHFMDTVVVDDDEDVVPNPLREGASVVVAFPVPKLHTEPERLKRGAAKKLARPNLLDR